MKANGKFKLICDQRRTNAKEKAMRRFIQTFCILAFAMTPPMGWNSWNAFEKEIDEEKIRAIADAMVSSGMREAGYTYLVLDDAWMAKKRDKDGRLVADPRKFPSGMKAIGDWV